MMTREISRAFAVMALAACALATAIGCQGKQKPDGMPELYKVKLIVTQDGAPLPDAALTLVSSDGSCNWAVGGKTDEKGVAELVTHGDYPGAPLGDFRVGVAKVSVEIREDAVDDEGNPIKPTEEQLKHPETMDARLVRMTSLIPDEYTNPQNSPLAITITEDVKEIPIDVPKREN